MIKIDDKTLRNKGYPFTANWLSNRFAHEVLPDGAWRNKPCFIIGGGPSLRDFDWNTLRGKRTIGINRVYEKFDPTIIFSMDTRFLLWIVQGKYGHEAADSFSRSAAYKIWLCTYNCKLPEDVFIIRVWKNYQAGFRAFTDKLSNGIGHGNNSGYAAMNLAACLGADPIYLLGFDMKYKTEDNHMQTHWHDGHPVPHRADTVYKFYKYFPYAAKGAKAMNLRIINLNLDSGLKCFPKKPWQGVLQ